MPHLITPRDVEQLRRPKHIGLQCNAPGRVSRAVSTMAIFGITFETASITSGSIPQKSSKHQNCKLLN